MSSKPIHDFSDSKLHSALLIALGALLVLIAIDAVFLTPEGQTPVVWRLDAVTVQGQSLPR